jgi:hypothetical protein
METMLYKDNEYESRHLQMFIDQKNIDWFARSYLKDTVPFGEMIQFIHRNRSLVDAHETLRTALMNLFIIDSPHNFNVIKQRWQSNTNFHHSNYSHQRRQHNYRGTHDSRLKRNRDDYEDDYKDDYKQEESRESLDTHGLETDHHDGEHECEHSELSGEYGEYNSTTDK